MAGLMLAHSNRFTEALRSLERALRCNPDNAEARNAMGKIHDILRN